eukprot:3939967-Rhodomonas_salina.1
MRGEELSPTRASQNFVVPPCWDPDHVLQFRQDSLQDPCQCRDRLESHTRDNGAWQSREGIRLGDLKRGGHRSLDPSDFRQGRNGCGRGWSLWNQDPFPAIWFGRPNESFIPGITQGPPKEGARRLWGIVPQKEVVPSVCKDAPIRHDRNVERISVRGRGEAGVRVDEVEGSTVSKSTPGSNDPLLVPLPGCSLDHDLNCEQVVLRPGNISGDLGEDRLLQSMFQHDLLEGLEGASVLGVVMIGDGVVHDGVIRGGEFCHTSEFGVQEAALLVALDHLRIRHGKDDGARFEAREDEHTIASPLALPWRRLGRVGLLIRSFGERRVRSDRAN